MAVIATSTDAGAALVGDEKKQPPHYFLFLSEYPVRVVEWKSPSHRAIESVAWCVNSDASHPNGGLCLYAVYQTGELVVYDPFQSAWEIALLSPRYFVCQGFPRLVSQSLLPSQLATPTWESVRMKTPEASIAQGGHSVTSLHHHRPSSHVQLNVYGTPARKRVAHSSDKRVEEADNNTKLQPEPSISEVGSRTLKKSIKHGSPSDAVPPLDFFSWFSPPGGAAAAAAAAAVIPEPIIDIAIVPSTRSLPPILLLLTQFGDVYAVKAMTERDQRSSDEVDHHHHPLYGADGRLTLSASPNLGQDSGVHHLIRGRGAKTAVAVRGVLVDEDTGTHLILIAHTSGSISGTIVDEPQLLARHRVTSSNPGELQPHRESLSLMVLDPVWYLQLGASLTTTGKEAHPNFHFDVQGNLCLVQYSEEEAYLVALPVWQVHRGGWSFWSPVLEDPQEAALEELRWSLLSTSPSVPEPLAVRVPLNLTGCCISLGARELLVGPQEGDEPLMSINASALLRSAIYATSESLQLSFDDSSAAKKGSASVSQHHPSKLLKPLCEAHQTLLCDPSLPALQKQLKDMAVRLERTVAAVEKRETALEVREKALARRIQSLQQRVAGATRTTSEWTQVVLDDVAHHRGESALFAANEKLGETHKMLQTYEDRLGIHPTSERITDGKQ